MSQIRPSRPRSRDEFSVAIICALTLEADAVLSQFDHHWDDDDSGVSFGKARGDPNAYSPGVLGKHNVVLAHLPGVGKVAAGTIAAFCRMSYPNISLALVVGICGGAPFYGNKKEEILLGDAIISTGVVQYDIGQRFPDDFKIKDTLDECLGRPGLDIRNLLSKLKTKRHLGKLQTAAQGYLHLALQEAKPGDYPERSQDILFPASYRHKHQEPSTCATCDACNESSNPVCETALKSSCKELKCAVNRRVVRSRVEELEKGNTKETSLPSIHFGRFASADTVMKSGEDRDHLTTSKDAIGFEMESAGVWDIFPCVIIKSVSDYADSHKNDNWQGYAALSAAACTKAFVRYWDSARDESETEEKHIEQFAKSLYFPEINSRKNNLNPEAPSTFRWIFDADRENTYEKPKVSVPEYLKSRQIEEDPTIWFTSDGPIDEDSDSKDGDSDSDEDRKFAALSLSHIKWDSFTDWLLSETPIYWINGNPGSGKSTLMKYLLEHTRTSELLTRWRANAVLLSHFFWKPGTRMQQSFKGLLCSLLYDLLSKDPETYHIARDVFTKTRRLSTSDWNESDLRCILLDYCNKLSKPVCFFVDGLDEAFLGKDVLDVVQFLKLLASCGSHVKVCLSSRPERLFRLHFETYPNLRMHELTQLDIARYSEHTMIESTLLDPEDQTISDLAFEIAVSSDGIFLWAVLATQSLIRGINNGDSKEQISERLESMPQDLMDLYRDIVSRSATDRPIYQQHTTLILNLVLNSSWSSYYTATPFMLTMAVDSELLERYVVRGDALRKSELEIKVKRTKDTVETALFGLLEVKKRSWSRSKLEEVVFLHRSAKDFLLDTVEGQNLWQLCNIPQEELWERHFKSLIADGRFHSEHPSASFTRGVKIRGLLNYMNTWEEEEGIPHDLIISFFELARVSFLRGHLRHSRTEVVDLKPRSIESQLLSHMAYGEHVHHAYEALDKYRDSTDESMYYLLFNLCELPTPQCRKGEMPLIQRILEIGYSPNWSAVNTPTITGNRLLASPWSNFLVNLLDRPWRFFRDTEKSELGPLFSGAIQMFLGAGASLESRFPVVVRLESYADSKIRFGLANQHTSRVELFLPQYIIFEMNAKAAVDLLMGHYYLSEPKASPITQPAFSTTQPHIKALAFTNRRDLLFYYAEDETISQHLVTTLQKVSLMDHTDEVSRHQFSTAARFQWIMATVEPFCSLAKDGYYWRGVRVKVTDKEM
ncbi:hypothetical protein FCIRC_2086 [Fusarium circinatum]|uniref:Nucleoside phosphorylase domain-containing protein n=1 Tax=Fusarium circinatum TaxID=48490 RepID=A0A8H5UCK3_FUSCI|nr:hypothetical protein FCIRC_2086 [Fusarium circinatum]